MHNTKLRLGVAAAAVVASLAFGMPAAQASPSVTTAPVAPTTVSVQDGGNWGNWGNNWRFRRFHNRFFFNRRFFGSPFFGSSFGFGGIPIVVEVIPGGFGFGGFGGFGGGCGFGC